MAALRKFLAALLVAAFVCVWLPSMPLAGGADDPGYVGGGGNKSEENPSSDWDPNTPNTGGGGSGGDPFQLTVNPDGGENLGRRLAKSLLLQLLGIIVR